MNKIIAQQKGSIDRALSSIVSAEGRLEDGFISKKWIDNNNYQAIFIEDEYYEEELDIVEKFCKNKNIGKIICMSLERNEPDIFEIIATTQGFTDADKEFPLESYMIFPITLEFVLLTDGDLYQLWIGPDMLLDQLRQGKSNEELLEDFDDYLTFSATQKGRNRLMSLAKSYMQ